MKKDFGNDYQKHPPRGRPVISGFFDDGTEMKPPMARHPSAFFRKWRFMLNASPILPE
jgi:hypothetical protein